MTNLEKIKKAEELLYEAHRMLESLKYENEEKKETQKEVLNEINTTYKKLRNNFNISLWGEVENEMKLSVNNLNTVYYDNGIYELEFDLDGKKVIITNVLEKHHPEAWTDEYYFENEEVVKEILINASNEDIIEG